MADKHLKKRALLGIGLTLLVSTIRLFAGVGKGTLAPWDPPVHLVVEGPYRYVRNPMHSGVFITLYGESLLVGSVPLLIFVTAVFIFHWFYNTHGHKLRVPTQKKAQFVTALGIYSADGRALADREIRRRIPGLQTPRPGLDPALETLARESLSTFALPMIYRGFFALSFFTRR